MLVTFSFCPTERTGSEEWGRALPLSHSFHRSVN